MVFLVDYAHFSNCHQELKLTLVSKGMADPNNSKKMGGLF